jgi:hypothetical protein
VTLQTLAYAQSIARDPQDRVIAVHVSDDPDDAIALKEEWEAMKCGVPLVQIESPYRSLVGPLLAFIDEERRQDPRATVSVILPEFVPRRWWEHLLHNQTALRLKGALLFHPGVVVTSVPYHLRPEPQARPAPRPAQEELPDMPRGEPVDHKPRHARVVRPGRPSRSS